MLESHTHDSYNEGRSDDQVSVFRFDDEGSGQELSVADIDLIVGEEVFVEEVFVLSQIPGSFVCHLREPNILPDCYVVTLDIFEEEADVHEDIEVVGLFDFIVLLGIHHKYFVLGVLSGKDVHFCVVE